MTNPLVGVEWAGGRFRIVIPRRESPIEANPTASRDRTFGPATDHCIGIAAPISRNYADRCAPASMRLQ